MDKVLSLSLIENALKVLKELKKTETPQTDGHADDPEAEAITALVAERTVAKKEKDFEKADKIRKELHQIRHMENNLSLNFKRIIKIQAKLNNEIY